MLYAHSYYRRTNIQGYKEGKPKTERNVGNGQHDQFYDRPTMMMMFLHFLHRPNEKISLLYINLKFNFFKFEHSYIYASVTMFVNTSKRRVKFKFLRVVSYTFLCVLPEYTHCLW